MASGQQIGTENTTLRLGGLAHGIETKTLHKTLSGLLFCLFKNETCAVNSIHISSKFTGELVYYLLYMRSLVFLVFMLNFRLQ